MKFLCENICNMMLCREERSPAVQTRAPLTWRGVSVSHQFVLHLHTGLTSRSPAGQCVTQGHHTSHNEFSVNTNKQTNKHHYKMIIRDLMDDDIEVAIKVRH